MNEYFLVNYDPADPNLPNGICGKCRKLLLEVNGLIIFHYENFNPHLFLIGLKSENKLSQQYQGEILDELEKPLEILKGRIYQSLCEILNRKYKRSHYGNISNFILKYSIGTGLGKSLNIVFVSSK